jgi:hypothetical protein
MKIDVKTFPNPNQQTNQNQIKTNPLPLNNNLNLEIVEEVVKKYLQNLSLSPQPQQNNLSNEFIVKSGMKASYLALRIENILLEKKHIVLSSMGYAIPVMIDTILLIKKDFEKRGIKLNIDDIQLFEMKVERKIISGVKAHLSI